MKIGLFTDSYFPQVSGVAASIKTLKESLEKEGHEVYIFTTTDPNVSEKEPTIIRMPSVPFVSFKDRRIVVRGMYSAYKIAKEIGLDIIHTQTEFGVGILGKMVAHQLKIPCVHTYHTMYEDYLHYVAKGKILRPSHVRLVSRAFARNLSGIVCPSLRVVDTLKGYGITTPLRVIPTGIDLSRFLPGEKAQEVALKIRHNWGYQEDHLILLSLSRLAYEKNIHETIKEFQKISQKLPQARLVIAGKGPYEAELKELAEKLGLLKVVQFVGEIDHDEVADYYRASDYFVSCSTSESQGLTYIEAIASGVPCVVCGNDYIDTLFDHPSLGTTFKKPNEFATTFLNYQKNQPTLDPAILQEKLYPLSSEKFVGDILDFYQLAFDFFTKEVLIEGKYDNDLVFPFKKRNYFRKGGGKS